MIKIDFMKKIYLKTWGCQMNNYDSNKIIDIFKETNKYNETKNYKIADIIIFNTCSVREKVQNKIFNKLLKFRKYKKKNKNLIFAIGGCITKKEIENIKIKIDYVDIIFSPRTIHKLPKLINNFLKKRIKIFSLKSKKNNKFNFYKQKFKSISAFVTINEGCNKYCSFCVVPFTRGKQISRSYKDILNEIKFLSKNGVKEICLLGQNVNSYSYFSKGKIFKFSKLLDLISKIKNIKRIKFLTSHPSDFKDDIINLYKKTPKLIDYLHLPVQSGSNRILKNMKRSYSINMYKNIVKKLKKIRPNICISTDIIIGFPGEKRKDFNKTLNLIKDLNLDNSFSFIYSKRPGTKAEKLKNNIRDYEKKYRLYKIQKVIKKQIIKWNLISYKTVQKILVEKKNKNILIGRNENNKLVFFIGSKNLIGKIVYVKIRSINNNFLKGKIVYN